MIRDGWKLIVRDGGGRGKKDTDPAELYHFAADPTEATDLAKQEPERVAAMRKLLVELRSGDRDDLPPDLVGIHD